MSLSVTRLSSPSRVTLEMEREVFSTSISEETAKEEKIYPFCILPSDRMRQELERRGIVDSHGIPDPSLNKKKPPAWTRVQWQALLNVLKNYSSAGTAKIRIGGMLFFLRLKMNQKAFGKADTQWLKGSKIHEIHKAENGHYYKLVLNVLRPNLEKLLEQFNIFEGELDVAVDTDWLIEATGSDIEMLQVGGNLMLTYVAAKTYLTALPTLEQMQEVRQVAFKDFTCIDPFSKPEAKVIDPSGNTFFMAGIGPNDLVISHKQKRQFLFDSLKMDIGRVFYYIKPRFYSNTLDLINEIEQFISQLNNVSELERLKLCPVAKDNDFWGAILARLTRFRCIKNVYNTHKKGFVRLLFDLSRGFKLCFKKDFVDLLMANIAEIKSLYGEISCSFLANFLANLLIEAVEDHSDDKHSIDYLALALIAVYSFEEIQKEGNVPEITEEVISIIWQKLSPKFLGEDAVQEEGLPILIRQISKKGLAHLSDIKSCVQLFVFTSLWQSINGRKWTELSAILTEHLEQPVASVILRRPTHVVYIPVPLAFDAFIPAIQNSIEFNEGWKEVLITCARMLLCTSLEPSQISRYGAEINLDLNTLIDVLKKGLDHAEYSYSLYCFALLIHCTNQQKDHALLKLILERFPDLYCSLDRNEDRTYLARLISHLVLNITKNVKIQFNTKMSKKELVEYLLSSFFQSPNVDYREFFIQLWERNSYQLTQKEAFEQGRRLILQVLPQQPLLALRIWSKIYTEATIDDKILIYKLVESIISLQKNNKWGSIPPCFKECVFHACNNHLLAIDFINRVLPIFQFKEWFKEGFAIVEMHPKFPKQTILQWILLYLNTMPQGSVDTIEERCEIIQKYPYDELIEEREKLCNDLDTHCRLSEKGWTRRQVQDLIQNGLESLDCKDLPQIVFIFVRRKIRAGVLAEALNRIYTEWNTIIVLPQFDDVYEELFSLMIEKKEWGTFLEKKPYEVTPEWLTVLHWKILKKIFNNNKLALRVTEWENFITFISQISRPQYLAEIDQEQYGIIEVLVNSAKKILQKNKLKIIPILEYVLYILTSHPKGRVDYSLYEKYLVLVSNLLECAYVKYGGSIAYRIEIEKCLLEFLIDLDETIKKIRENSVKLQVIQTLTLWIDKTKIQLLKLKSLKEIFLSSAPIHGSLLLIIYQNFIFHRVANELSNTMEGFNLVKKFFIRCLDANLIEPSVAMAKTLVETPTYSKNLDLPTVERLFACCIQSFKLNLKEFNSLFDLLRQFSSPHKKEEFYKEKWLSLAYFFRNNNDYFSCIRALAQITVFENQQKYLEINKLVLECVQKVDSIYFQSHNLSIFVTMLIRYPIPDVKCMLNFFEYVHKMQALQRGDLLEILIKMEEKEIFNENFNERYQCWKLAISSVKSAEQLLKLLEEEDSLLYQAFPEELNTTIISDFYLVLIESSIPFIKNENLLKNVLKLFDGMIKLSTDLGDPDFCILSFLQTWILRFYEWMNPDWVEQYPKMKALRKNIEKATKILLPALESVENHNCTLYYVILLMENLKFLFMERTDSLRKKVDGLATKVVEIDDLIVKRSIKLLNITPLIPFEKYQSIHGGLIIYISRLVNLNLSENELMAIVSGCLKHVENSPDVIVKAANILMVIIEKYKVKKEQFIGKEKFLKLIKKYLAVTLKYSTFNHSWEVIRVINHLYCDDYIDKYTKDEWLQQSLASKGRRHPHEFDF